MGRGIARVALATVLAIASFPFASPAAPARAAGCGTVGQPTRTLYLPNITRTLGGPLGWVTPFIVQNVGVATTDLEVSFYRFSDGAFVTCRRVAGLPPYRSFADFPNNDVDLPADSQFAVVVRSFGSDVVAVVNEQQGEGTSSEALSYVGLSSGARTEALPYVAKFVNGWLTTFVMQNLGTATATVTARFVSFDGTQSATLTRVIAPGASKFVNPVAEPSLVAGTEYSVVLTADQPIAAIANAHNDAPGAIAPMGFSYNAIVAAPDVAYVPSVMRNADGGRNTRLVIQNAGAADATPSLLFRRAGAAPVTITPPTPVHPGRSWSFDPRYLADGTTPCPAVGAANCLGEGDWSLTVSGGEFAPVAITTTATTAFGYIAAQTPGNRSYLPNVTRTLGGGDGWTTPILLQSAGATSATLRWYRFADGALMARQVVSGLSSGAAIRVDPRAVAGLTDDTQYAVLVDAAGGNIVATVLELQFQGGDGAMAYEGFKATVSTVPAPTMLTAIAAKTSAYTGARVQAGAIVKDQFDNVMSTPVTWSVAPASIGTVSASGLFSAAEGATGVANVTASAAGLSSTVAITISERPRTALGGIEFAFDGTGLADVYTQPTISGVDASTVAAEIDLDVAAVQADYGRSYASRPRLYFLGDTATYANALESIFQYDPVSAQQLSTTTDGLYLPSPNAVLIDWSKIHAVQPLSTPRHELTHMMEEQITGATQMPAWLNEGNARLEELTVPGSRYLATVTTYGAASMAATGTLFTLANMTSQLQWSLRPGLAGEYQYHAAGQAVLLLRARIGAAGILRILDTMGGGATFEDAYAAVAGEPFDVFAASYGARVLALSPVYPSIATAPDTIAGPGLSLFFYGFRPGSTVTYSVQGGTTSARQSAIVSQFGTVSTYLGSDWPAGAYTVSASWSGGTVTTTTVKIASLEDPLSSGQ